MNRTLEIVLLIIGIVMPIWSRSAYIKKEKVVGAGPIQLSADKETLVNWPLLCRCNSGDWQRHLILTGKRRVKSILKETLNCIINLNTNAA